MIRWIKLSLRHGAKLLLEDADAVVHPGEKVGLVGANGSGKSTLFALLRGDLSPDQGDFSIPARWRIAHVAQETVATDQPAVEFVIDGDTSLRRIEAEIATHADRPSSDAEDHALAELHAAYGDADGYTAASRAERLLLGLGFTLEEARRPVRTFSGGWRMRLQLAQALMAPSDLLLLDEPTNHLDLDAILWLEQWLKEYRGTLLVISHDREFLDTVCNAIVSIETRKLSRWSGNYSAFELQRAERLMLLSSAHAKQQAELAHLQRFVDRFKAKASKARQAQSRVKAMERMTRIAPVIAASPFSFRFRDPLQSPDPMLILEGVDCGYRDDATGATKVIVSGLGLRLAQGERIGLLGANGQGKSTVVKTIAGTIAPLGGAIVPGKGLAIGYFAQHQVDMLDLASTPLEQLHRIAARGDGPRPREQELRNFLGSFAFNGDMVSSPVAPFSGGEKARLALALIIWTRPNLLLLDEPTNHLDLETREALMFALAQFSGTLILVSHDRALLRASTDRFLLVSAGRCTEFDGDLEDYRAWLMKKTEPVVAAAKPDAPSVSKATRPAVVDRAQRREDAASRAAESQRRKPIEQRIRRLETKLAEASARRTTIETALADSGIYDDARKEELKALLVEQAYVTREIERIEADWLEQQTLLEEAA